MRLPPKRSARGYGSRRGAGVDSGPLNRVSCPDRHRLAQRALGERVATWVVGIFRVWRVEIPYLSGSTKANPAKVGDAKVRVLI